MSENEESNKTGWNDKNTRVMLVEFKIYYELWQMGKIDKKKQMWIKIADAMNEKGYICTGDQVENRFKTLQRSCRNSNLSLTSRRNKTYIYSSEFPDLFENCMFERNADNSADPNLRQEEELETPDSPLAVVHNESRKQSVLTRLIEGPRVKVPLQRRKSSKTSVEVLAEIKELVKKIEIRRQMRHEQRMTMETERNDIMKQKNKLLEQIILFGGDL